MDRFWRKVAALLILAGAVTAGAVVYLFMRGG